MMSYSWVAMRSASDTVASGAVDASDDHWSISSELSTCEGLALQL